MLKSEKAISSAQPATHSPRPSTHPGSPIHGRHASQIPRHNSEMALQRQLYLQARQPTHQRQKRQIMCSGIWKIFLWGYPSCIEKRRASCWNSIFLGVQSTICKYLFSCILLPQLLGVRWKTGASWYTLHQQILAYRRNPVDISNVMSTQAADFGKPPGIQRLSRWLGKQSFTGKQSVCDHRRHWMSLWEAHYLQAMVSLHKLMTRHMVNNVHCSALPFALIMSRACFQCLQRVAWN